MKPNLLTAPVLEHPLGADTSFKKPLRLEQFSQPAVGGVIQETESPVRSASKLRPHDSGTGIILLMSDDAGLVRNLRSAAEQGGWTMVRVVETAETFRTLRVNRPAVVLLDLDLFTGAAWEAADRLLQEASCPPIVLLTARVKQMNFVVAVRAGSIVDKSAEPGQILQVVEQVLQAPHSTQAERIAFQRLIILQLNPFNWPVPMPAYRDFGIND